MKGNRIRKNMISMTKISYSEQARAERNNNNILQIQQCHSESLEKYYEFTNSYFSCYSESINDDEKTIELNRFRIKSGMTSIRKHTGDITKVSAPLEGEVARSAKGGSTNNMTKNNGLLRRFAPRNDVNHLSTYPLINLPTYKRKVCTAMTKNENVKKTLEAGVLTKRHSEGISPKNPLHILKRFFAKYKFPFAGNCVRPSQNDGKILVPLPQDPTPKSKISTLSHTARSFTRLAGSPVQLVPQGAGIKLPSSCCARGEGHNNVKHLFTYSLINLFTFKKQAAFTLAEVLITLGIIGVVAAMTIPNLMQKNFEKRVVSQLLETQSILSQAFRMAEEEYDEVENWGLTAWDSTSAELVAQRLKPYIKVALDCGLEDSEGHCTMNGEYERLNGVKHGINYATDIRYYKISLMNGSSVWWRAANEYDSVLMLWIDVNGNKKPNTYGKDLFILTYSNKSIKPDGAPGTAHEGDCSTSSWGYGCAYYVLQNKNLNYLH